MFIFLLVVCAIFCSALVYPLCTFATNFQSAYSFAVSALILCLLAFLAAKQVKKHGAKSALFFLIKSFIVITGITAVFAAVFSGKRLLALLALAATLALFALAARFLKSSAKELAAEKS